LRAKLYSYKMGGEVKKKCKGIQKVVVKNIKIKIIEINK